MAEAVANIGGRVLERVLNLAVPRSISSPHVGSSVFWRSMDVSLMYRAAA